MRAPGVREAMLARMAQTVLEPPEPILATITCPVLVLWGALDRAIPASHAADWQRMLPHAQVVILPGLGHVPQEEAPERSLEPVRAFLDS
jgi:pimeloyl-ACP methyl ester carboxylesterase